MQVYSDIKKMSALASKIIGISIACSVVRSGADQRKHQISASLAFLRGNHRLPLQKVSNAENASIWWRHNASGISHIW